MTTRLRRNNIFTESLQRFSRGPGGQAAGCEDGQSRPAMARLVRASVAICAAVAPEAATSVA
jgi:hypothetical protein